MMGPQLLYRWCESTPMLESIAVEEYRLGINVTKIKTLLTLWRAEPVESIVQT